MRWAGYLLLGVAAASIACMPEKSTTGVERICTPDAYVFCRCQDRTQGTKKCHEDGAGFDECLPCDGSGNTGIGSGGEDPLGAPGGSDIGDEGQPEEEGEPADAPLPKSQKGDASTPVDASVSDARPRDASTTRPVDASVTPPPPQPPVTAEHCKPLKNIAPPIELQRVPDEPGTVEGGTPAKGVYVQAWAVEFTGRNGPSGPSKIMSRKTIEIGDGVGRYVFEDDDGKTISGGFRLTTTGNRATVAYECPAAPPAELTYDVNGASLTLYDPPYARVFVLQTQGAGGDR